MSVFLGELIGTMILVTLGCGVVGAICIATILGAQLVDKEQRVQPKIIKKQPVEKQ